MKKTIERFEDNSKKLVSHTYMHINSLNTLPNIKRKSPGNIKSNIVEIVYSSVRASLIKYCAKIGIHKYAIT